MVAGVLALVFVAVLPRSLWAEDRDVIAVARASVGKLVATSGSGRYFVGSGVALADGSMVTNCHVIRGARAIAVGQGQGPTRATARGLDWHHDLCRLQMSDLKLRPATLRDARSLRIGEKVYAVGHNYGQGLSWEKGRVEELYPLDGGAVIRTTASFATGASGGGLFDEEGRLVGILTFYRVVQGRHAEYFAVPVEWIAGIPQTAEGGQGAEAGTPFWAQSLDDQPNFLKAATLEMAERWDELLTLSRAWTEHFPADGHAWSTLGKSLDRAGDQQSAEEAFRRAAELGVRRASLP